MPSPKGPGSAWDVAQKDADKDQANTYTDQTKDDLEKGLDLHARVWVYL